MIDPLNDLTELVRAAVTAAFGAAAESTEVAIRRSERTDYQADVAMALARKLQRNPREIAAAIVAQISGQELLVAAEVSGPGFINLTCSAEYLGRELDKMRADERLGIERAAEPQTVVVDFSSPNLAKEMHAGHLRSTIIGDALARVLEHLGHEVVRQNHLGDWGTPFGMLIERMLDEGTAGGEDGVRELSAFYRAARSQFDTDPEFADRARRRVVALQNGDEATLALWRQLIRITFSHIDALYRRLQISLGEEHIAGESRYNEQLPDIAAELEQRGMARMSDGALCVFPPGFSARDGSPLPLIVRKQDGGFGYAATDLAALRYRLNELHATRLLYVVGTPQSQHFAMLFETARLAGWVGETVRLEHVAFGSVLGQDGKMLKSRAGETVSLTELLDEASARARAVVDQGSPSLSDAARARIADIVGSGAVKYADLVNDRIRDYVFNWDRMLAFDGNTATYLMYGHARIRSILRKAAALPAVPTDLSARIRIDAPAERALGLEMLEFPATVARVAESSQPHRLCQQLFRIATAFSSFYEACPVLGAEPHVRAARLSLCDLTARVLACGLGLLGIEAPDSM